MEKSTGTMMSFGQIASGKVSTVEYSRSGVSFQPGSKSGAIVIEEEEDAVPELEPDITSSDPEIRKLARSLRIQRRMEAIKKQREKTTDEDIEVQKTELEIQVVESAEQLERLLLEGEELITNVAVGGDQREVQRRECERELRQKLIEKLDEEANEATEAFERINGRWCDLLLLDDPLDVHDGISAQKGLCDELIAQKDNLIGELRTEIDRLELEYTKDLESQKDELALLAERIDKQVSLMRSAYRHELLLLEAAADAEWKNALEQDLQSWQDLYKQRNELEEQNMMKKLEQQETFLVELDENRIANEELYHDMKITLDNELQVLQQELEHVRAFCLLNEEKLDYNYQILKKREDENMIIRSQQKRLLNRLRDELASLRHKTEEQKISGEQTERRLQQEIHRLRNSVFQVEAKADLLETVNDTKYSQVWQHNEHLAEQKLQQILAADRSFSENLLGLEWQPPRRPRVRLHSLPSYKQAQHLMALQGKTSRPKSQASTGTGTTIESSAHNPIEFPESLQKILVGRVGERADFLIETQLAPLIAELPREQGDVVRVDSVFGALGVNRTEDMELLMDCFSPYVYCPVCEADDAQQLEDVHEIRPMRIPSSATSITMHDLLQDVQQPAHVLEEVVNTKTDIETAEPIPVDTTVTPSDTRSVCLQEFSLAQLPATPITRGGTVCIGAKGKRFKEGHPITIESGNVFPALREYATRTGMTAPAAREPGIEYRVRRDRVTVSRCLTREDVETFWEQFAEAFPDERLKMWDLLLDGLTRYHSVLQERHRINTEVLALRKQNTELRHLLQTCMPASKDKKRTSKKGTKGTTCSYMSSVASQQL